MRFPNHRYLGPGNSLNIGAPVDIDDAIAEKHDIEYDKIVERSDKNFKEDIFAADRKAIGDFTSDAITNLNWHSAVGALGLGTKHIVEKLTNNIIYPGMSNIRLTLQEGTQKKPWFAYKYNKGKRATDNSGNKPNKRSKNIEPIQDQNKSNQAPMSTEQDGTSSAMDTANVQGDQGVSSFSGGNSAASGTGAGLRGAVALPSGIKNGGHSGFREYTKEYFFRIASEPAELRKTTDLNGSTNNWCRYNLHDIPVHMLGFYLSHEEILELQRHTRATIIRAECKVFNRTARLPFNTNQTVSSIGNNNVGVYALVMENLRKKRVGRLPNQGAFITDKIWGKHVSQLSLTNAWTQNLSDISASFVERNLSNKFEYRLPDTESPVGQENYLHFRPHMFPWANFVKTRRNASMVEGLLEEWAYEPKCGVIASNDLYSYIPNGSLGVGTNTVPTKPTMVKNIETFMNASYATSDLNTSATEPYGAYLPSQSTIGWEIHRGVTNNHHANLLIDDHHVQDHNGNVGGEIPTLVIGMEPVLNKDLTNVEAFMPIHIQVRLIVKVDLGVDYVFPWGGNFNIPNFMNPVRSLVVHRSTGQYEARSSENYFPAYGEVETSEVQRHPVSAPILPTTSNKDKHSGEKHIKDIENERLENEKDLHKVYKNLKAYNLITKEQQDVLDVFEKESNSSRKRRHVDEIIEDVDSDDDLQTQEKIKIDNVMKKLFNKT